jgi:hypothetical protein
MARSRTRSCLGLLLAVCAAVTAACAGQEQAEPPPMRAYTVEELAEKLGCTPEFQGRTSDFRQAACLTDATRYMLLDFTSEQKKKEWLEYAVLYHNAYLVGEKWALTSDSFAAMERFRGEVGGTLEGETDIGATHHG